MAPRKTRARCVVINQPAAPLTTFPGIAVSAGELEEGQARVFEETREELEQVIVALTEARKENQSLKSRIVALEGASGDD